MADITAAEARQAIARLRTEVVASLSDAYYFIERYRVEELADLAVQIFGREDQSRSQIKGLEEVARSAHSASEVLDHIKSQAGRDKRPGPQWRQGQFADRLLGVLLDKVCPDAERQAKRIKQVIPKKAWKTLQGDEEDQLGYDERELERELRLDLTRAYLRHLTARYTYKMMAHR